MHVYHYSHVARQKGSRACTNSSLNQPCNGYLNLFTVEIFKNLYHGPVATHGQSSHIIDSTASRILPVPIMLNFYYQEQAWRARAHPPQHHKERGGPTCETTKHETRKPINCRTIYNIHNIINTDYFAWPTLCLRDKSRLERET